MKWRQSLIDFCLVSGQNSFCLSPILIPFSSFLSFSSTQSKRNLYLKYFRRACCNVWKINSWELQIALTTETGNADYDISRYTLADRIKYLILLTDIKGQLFLTQLDNYIMFHWKCHVPGQSKLLRLTTVSY